MSKRKPRPTKPDAARQFRQGKFKQVRVPDWLATWATGVAETVNADELPDVKMNTWEVPSRRQLIEQAIIWGLQRLDPTGEHSPFGTGGVEK